MDIIDPRIEQYAEQHSTPEPAHLAALAAETRERTQIPQMMVGPLEGGFLAMLAWMVRPARVLEIGTFTGYSSISMAAALPPGATITTCELDPVHAEIARRHIATAGLADVIEVREGKAIDTLASLAGPFDLVFIDADKGSYLDYYEAVLPKLADDGVIAVDNVLWSGTVLEPPDDPDCQAIAAFNDHVVNDARVVCVLVPIRDGVTLIRKRR